MASDVQSAPIERPSKKVSWRRRVVLIVLGLAVASIGALGAIIWRGVPFPLPTGPYPIGRTTYHLRDESRPEIFSEADDDVRELMMSVHYPADQTAGTPRAAYADASLVAGIAEAFNAPSIVVNSFRSHALQKPPCQSSEEGFPVVIFSPGFGAPPLFYTATLEDLASHGFIVVSVYHPYSNGVTVFPDGRLVRQNEAGSQSDISLDGPDESQELTPAPPDDVGAVWVKDVRFVLDELTRLNRDDELLAGRLNLSKVGIFGHSFGGATAARTVQIDERFLAGINMDGTDFAVTQTEGIGRPFMWMSASLHEITDKMLAQAGKTRAWADEASRRHQERTESLLHKSPEGSRALVRGAEHQTFASDVTLLASTFPFSWYARGMGVGTIPGWRAVSLVDALVVGFFQKHLQGKSVPLLDGSTGEFPEVELQRGQP